MHVNLKNRFNNIFFSNDENSNHIKSLDGLRGLAVLFVVLSHASNAGILLYESINFRFSGKIGVYLFFLLSAFLLDTQIIKNLKNKNADIHFWINYFLRRILRIYSLFILSLLLYHYLSPYGVSIIIDNKDNILEHIFLLKGENIFWSIPVEFKYYLLSPIILYLCHRFFNWNKTFTYCFLILLIIGSTLTSNFYNLSSISLVKYLPPFIIGTIIAFEYIIQPKFNSKSVLDRMPNLPLISLGIIVLLIPDVFSFVFSTKINIQGPAFIFPYSVLWGILLLSLLHKNHWIKQFFEWKMLRFIGVISYSVYLLHALILNFIRSLTIQNYYKFPVFLISTIFLSVLSFYIIERPFSKIYYSKRK